MTSCACIAAAAGFPTYDSSCIISRTCIATLNCNCHGFSRAWQQLHDFLHLYYSRRSFPTYDSSCIISRTCIATSNCNCHRFSRVWQQLHDFRRLYCSCHRFSRAWQQMQNFPRLHCSRRHKSCHASLPLSQLVPFTTFESVVLSPF